MTDKNGIDFLRDNAGKLESLADELECYRVDVSLEMLDKNADTTVFVFIKRGRNIFFKGNGIFRAALDAKLA